MTISLELMKYASKIIAIKKMSHVYNKIITNFPKIFVMLSLIKILAIFILLSKKMNGSRQSRLLLLPFIEQNLFCLPGEVKIRIDLILPINVRKR